MSNPYTGGVNLQKIYTEQKRNIAMHNSGLFQINVENKISRAGRPTLHVPKSEDFFNDVAYALGTTPKGLKKYLLTNRFTSYAAKNEAAAASIDTAFKAFLLLTGISLLAYGSGCIGNGANVNDSNRTMNSSVLSDIFPQNTPAGIPGETPAYNPPQITPTETPTNGINRGNLTIYGNNRIYKINYSDRIKINAVLKDTWGRLPENFDKYYIANFSTDVYLLPNQELIQVDKRPYAALFKIVSNKTGKADNSSGTNLSDIVESWFSQALSQNTSVHIIKDLSGDNHITPPAIVVKSGKVAVSHISTSRDDYIAIGANTEKGILADNSMKNMEQIIGDNSLYGGSSGGGSSSSSSGSGSEGSQSGSSGNSGSNGGVSGGRGGNSGGTV